MNCTLSIIIQGFTMNTKGFLVESVSSFLLFAAICITLYSIYLNSDSSTFYNSFNKNISGLCYIPQNTMYVSENGS